MKFIPEITLGVKPAPIDAIMDVEFMESARRLVQLHASAPEMLDVLKQALMGLSMAKAANRDEVAEIVVAMIKKAEGR
jgi:hypothetical protein